MATPDQLTAYLDGVRGDIGALEALVTRLTTFAVPVAEFNAAQDRLAGHTPRLLAAVEAVLALAAKHEHGATRWEDPLPVPSWIPELREAISAALLRGEPDA